MESGSWTPPPNVYAGYSGFFCCFCSMCMLLLGLIGGVMVTRVLPFDAFDWVGRWYLFGYQENFEVRQTSATHMIPLKGSLRLNSNVELDILFGDSQTTDFSINFQTETLETAFDVTFHAPAADGSAPANWITVNGQNSDESQIVTASKTLDETFALPGSNKLKLTLLKYGYGMSLVDGWNFYSDYEWTIQSAGATNNPENVIMPYSNIEYGDITFIKVEGLESQLVSVNIS